MGLAGGPARAMALSPAVRKEIAKKASQACWNKPDTSLKGELNGGNRTLPKRRPNDCKPKP